MNCICENCKYFVQHYVFNDGFLNVVECGHCEKNTKLAGKRKRCSVFEKKNNNVQQIDKYLKVFTDLTHKGYEVENILKFLHDFKDKIK